jgi:hypothetical protein
MKREEEVTKPERYYIEIHKNISITFISLIVLTSNNDSLLFIRINRIST